MDRPMPSSPDLSGLTAPTQIRAWKDQDLELAPRLRPMDISVDLQTECVRTVDGEDGPTFDIRATTVAIRPSRAGLVCYAAGIRAFNGPREVIIEEIRLGSASRGIYSAPFDAAAFQLETPLPPLRGYTQQPYEGEPMRFCQQDLGCFSHEHPLYLKVSPWRAMEQGFPATGFPPFDALLFVHETERG